MNDRVYAAVRVGGQPYLDCPGSVHRYYREAASKLLLKLSCCWQKKSLAPFATIATVGVLRMEAPDNSRVSRSIGI